MSAPAPVVHKSVERLRGQMIRTARGFRDYNFRHYFVQHVKDDFAAIALLPVEAQKKFAAAEGREKLRQLQRMVVVNQMYANRPVYIDSIAQKSHDKQSASPGRPIIE
ncbi:iron-sulfur cluster assembly protein [Novymonas esmeraldas]|uniref:Iron-sulfur cluster assembly protein n=1 Tax=Novymonas esmeraldas TaxID=1808958 RepID=A0AAW0ERS4_9TRYP